MAAGYSGTPLVGKLGIKAGMTGRVLEAPAHYWTLLGELPDDVDFARPAAGGLDFVHVFVRELAELRRRVPELRGSIAQNGMIWVSWPKKASGVATDVTEDVVREVALAHGLVDVKVCAVDETWSGLKLVIRRADRR